MFSVSECELLNSKFSFIVQSVFFLAIFASELHNITFMFDWQQCQWIKLEGDV
jgi:hypothetical protein